MPKVCPVCETVYPDANAFCPVDGTTLHVVDLEGGLIGSVVADRYLVTDLLGEGGMGKVYLARHVRLPQQAAIKVLRKEMVRDPAAVARFNREASNASRIDDEHVARVYDFGEASGGTVYLAMEYVAGRTLRELLTRQGALEPRRAVALVDQIAKGLDAAHRLKIIHRDLKPDNILVVEGSDGRDRVKVVDFGIAKAFGAEDGNLTKTGFVVGTPEFMSPEQLMGSALDARSDVYALALVAFQCFTASLPFGGDTPEQAMTARLMSPPRRLADVSGRDWPPQLQAAFDAALSREVAGRPESAGEFARLLTSAVEGWIPGEAGAAAPSAEARAATPRGAAKGSTVKIAEASGDVPPAPRRRAPALAAVVAMLAVGGFFAYRSLQQSNAATPQQSPVVGGATSDSANVAMPAGPPADSSESAAGDLAEGGIVTSATTATDSAPPARTSAPVPKREVAATNADSAANRRRAAAAESPAPRAVVPPAPPAPPVSPVLRETLDSLSGALQRRGVNDATARRIAGELRALAPQLPDASLKTRAYFRLIDASALSGDLTGACAAFRLAQGTARGDAQLTELRKYEQDLGCG